MSIADNQCFIRVPSQVMKKLRIVEVIGAVLWRDHFLDWCIAEKVRPHLVTTGGMTEAIIFEYGTDDTLAAFKLKFL